MKVLVLYCLLNLIVFSACQEITPISTEASDVTEISTSTSDVTGAYTEPTEPTTPCFITPCSSGESETTTTSYTEPSELTSPTAPTEGPGGQTNPTAKPNDICWAVTCDDPGKCAGQNHGSQFDDDSGKGYIVCQCECEIKMMCPEGLVFNSKLKVCDWPSATAPSTPTAFTTLHSATSTETAPFTMPWSSGATEPTTSSSLEPSETIPTKLSESTTPTIEPTTPTVGSGELPEAQ